MFEIMNGYWLPIVDLVFIGIAVWVVSQKPTARRLLGAGLGLLLGGLVATLVANFFHGSSTALTEQLRSFLTNFSLITAGVGGNLIAASAVIENQAKVNGASGAPSP